MTRPVVLRPDSQSDVESAYEALEQAQQGLGRRFASELHQLLVRIESTPELYGVVTDDIRAARLMKFRYVIYYVVFSDRIEVLAVLHGSRDPAVWQQRQ